MQDIFKIVKDANIDDLYLSQIGYNASKKSGCCPIHNGDNKNGFSYTDKKGYRQYSCWTKGCIGQGVDIIEACKVKESLIDRFEAAKYLANMFNIELPAKEYTKEEKQKFKDIKEQKKKNDINIFKLNMATKEAKDINKKFELSCLSDKLDDSHEVEVINYSNYKANEVHNINTYISESTSGIINSITSASNGGNHLLIAPTGSGKTYTSIDILKKFNIKTIFVLPNASNVHQVMNDYDIPGAYDNISLVDQLSKGDLITCTWDKLSQLKGIDLSEYIMLLDEAHQIYTDMFRHKAIKNMIEVFNSFKGRLDITATPTVLDFNIYDYIVEYKQDIQTDYKVKLYDNIDTKTITNIINNSDKAMCLMNDKSTLKTLQQMTNKKSDIIHSDNKHISKLYDNIMTNSNMGEYEVMFNTSCMLASFNIKNENATDIIIIGGKNPIKDIGTIKQYVARPRGLEKINVHIFNTYKDECNVLAIDWAIKQEIKKYKTIASTYDDMLKSAFSTVKINAESSKLDGYIYYDKETNTHKVDALSIRAEIYKQYYNSRTIEHFMVLLQEYFQDIEIVKGVQEQQVEIIKADKKFIKEAKENAIEILSKDKNILVGYEDIVKCNNNYKLYNYMINNKLNETKTLELYKDKNIHNTINDNELINFVNQYSKYVLDYNYSYDLSWKLADMTGEARKWKFTEKIKNIIHEKIKNLYPGEVIDTIDNRVYEFIINRFKPGISYTSEHIEILSNELTEVFKDKKKYNQTNLRKLLNSIYSISCKEYKISTLPNINYYRNIVPGGVETKRIRVYTVANLITIEDIKKELQICSSDKSIENTINKKTNKLIDIYNQEKQIEKELLEDLFNIC